VATSVSPPARGLSGSTPTARTIDGRRSAGFQGRSFHFASTIQKGAAVVATGEDPLGLLSSGDVRIDRDVPCDASSFWRP
jgi:hypothetical protein